MSHSAYRTILHIQACLSTQMEDIIHIASIVIIPVFITRHVNGHLSYRHVINAG